MTHIITKEIPKHIAIIMDGNGRWARKKGKLRLFGHKNGVKSVKDIVEGSVEFGVHYLTLFAFSKENWDRPKKEISALMTLLVSSIQKEKNTLIKHDICLQVIGNISDLPEGCKIALNSIIQETKKNKGMTLILALSYGSRWEIISAIKKLSNKVLNKEINTSQIDDSLFSEMLYTKNLPDPDLLIRTGGVFRISNFLLWQIAYTEIHVTETFWPEFGKKELFEAIYDFQNRERRFGKISEQLKVNNG